MKRKEGGLRRLLVPGLCAVFFILAMSLALTAAGTYRHLTAAAGENSTQRTGLSYLANQVRRADRPQGIRLTRFGGGDALELHDGLGYVTYIYCYDGALRELYTDPQAQLGPADGTELLPAGELTITAGAEALTLSLDGCGVTLRPRCGFEEVPGQ